MFKIERHKRIKEILKDCHQIEVSTLSNLLNVTEATIRKDLEELEQDGFLTRFHGGATLNSENSSASDIPFLKQITEYDKNKEDIGRTAAQLINDREWIFLGPGTTTFYIACALRDRTNVNVLTNNFLAAQALYNISGIRLVFLGGQVEYPGFYTNPDNLKKYLENIFLDKSFFSTDGVDIHAGYTLSDRPVQELISSVSRCSRETIMAFDYTKYNQRSFMKIGDLDFTSTIITNPAIPDNYRQYFLEHKIRVYTPFNLQPIHF
ncbi:DeoR/GlpR family DNA-binding transcription regulator [Mediterraneibacter gnavus]|uniref:DeoR/GlpR family DNA-binding transcription regulator n=1 Tax=Mediterraneibacter gnavus TaxID=33038 RepID=UPI00232EFD9B|nr:DeoR/GlpR family DNA-binding transcription regulator [Mediterraneibacter gnavus]MDB8710055.1 DeoR/GlpR family DNA-binding transcription regulator [Mediterraneibacter gnavus]MDB8713476.1 DeoR/GlpR family DNA-binding transcription regulator [Mediterraneibacter gnavus]